jgi:predicted dehydrogenase
MIRIGIVGAGIYGLNHFDAFFQRQRLNKDIEVVGFAEVSAQRRTEMESKYPVPGFASHLELIEKARPDAITVATPDHLHHAIVMESLKAGLPVLVEKPLATDVAEAKEMAQLARAKRLLLQIDFHKRFDPYHLDLKMRIEDGELGKIQYGYCWMEDMLKVGTGMIGKKSWTNQGSPAWFLGIHMIDLSYWMMDFPKPLKVYAHGFKGKLQSLGIDIYDSVKADVTYDNGTVVTYDTSVILPNTHEAIVRQGIKMVGTEGFMEVNSQYRGARGCSTNKGMETPNLGMSSRRPDKLGGINKIGYGYDSICDFIENLQFLRSGHTIEELEGKYANPEQGVETTRVGVAIHESIATGKVCDLSMFQ